MMTVAKLAKETRVNTDTIRYYVRIGLLKPEREKVNNYHIFSPQDANQLKFIHHAKHLGYTLKEIQQIIKQSEAGNSPCPIVREIIQNRIEDTRRKVQELQDLQRRMEAALQQWKDMPDGEPDGHCICHLIEAISV